MLRSLTTAFATAFALNPCLSAQAETPLQMLEGGYTLESSTTAPAGNWVYTQAYISIHQLDDRHALILLACEWKREPKAACSDYFHAQLRDGGVYMQDMNTDGLRLYFDPASRTLTLISRAADAPASVRRDVFLPTGRLPDDPALSRRLKRAQGNAENRENQRVFGHYSKRSYLKNRIEFQAADLAPSMR